MGPEQRLLGYDVQDKKFIDMQTGNDCTQREIRDFIEYLFQRYNIDSQGFCEYMKSILGNEGIDTDKIWREVKGDYEKRYSRCLVFDFNSKTYLIDTVDKTLQEVDRKDLAKKYILKPEEKRYPYFGG